MHGNVKNPNNKSQVRVVSYWYLFFFVNIFVCIELWKSVPSPRENFGVGKLQLLTL